jgi:acetyl-CoA synthetase
MSEKVYPVSAEWAQRAYVDDAKYKEFYDWSVSDPEAFWGEQGKRIDWIKPYTKVKNVSYDPHNVSIKSARSTSRYNCIDRHLKKRGDQVAIIWEGDDPDESKNITYASCTSRSAASPTC